MGTEAPRWWKHLLDQLQAAAAEATAAAAADSSAASKGWQPINMQALYETNDDLDGLPNKLPKAVWKKVLALQVLTGLLSFCYSVWPMQSAAFREPCLPAEVNLYIPFVTPAYQEVDLLPHRCLTSLSQCAASSPTLCS